MRRSFQALCAVFIASFVSAAGAFAQEGGYAIDSVSYEIRGRTKDWALAKVLDIDIGRPFADRAALDAFVADRVQLLENQRVIEEAQIEVQELPAPEGGAVPVRLVVRTKDTYSIIALPKPQYDSNDGLLLSVKARDYNFLGTMQPLKLDLNYTMDTSGHQDWGVELQFSLPFQVGGLDYSWNLDQTMSYSQDKVFSAMSKTGVDLSLPLWSGKLTLGPSQSYYLHPDNSDGKVFFGWFLKSTASAAYSIPLPVDFGYFGKLNASADAGISENWNPTGMDILDERDGPTLDFSQKLSFGRVDWMRNFRRGLSASASVSESYNLSTEAWSRSADATVAGFYPFGERLGFSGRLKADFYLDGTDDSAGSPLRGILDSRVHSDASIYANLDFPFALIRFMPQDWFHSKGWRIISFEQHWSPFLDAALTHDATTKRWFDPRDGWYAGGLEVITYPAAFRVFYLRISAGWDLAALFENIKADSLSLKTFTADATRDRKKGYELFIGIGSHY
jgi:hypothetical protein